LESFKRLPGFAVGDSGQDTRAAARFALLAMAGELATEYGVTGWAPGQARRDLLADELRAPSRG